MGWGGMLAFLVLLPLHVATVQMSGSVASLYT